MVKKNIDRWIAANGYIVFPANLIKGKSIFFKSLFNFPIARKASTKSRFIELPELTRTLVTAKSLIYVVMTSASSWGLVTCSISSSEKGVVTLSVGRGLFPSVTSVEILATYTSQPPTIFSSKSEASNNHVYCSFLFARGTIGWRRQVHSFIPFRASASFSFEVHKVLQMPLWINGSPTSG